jgi:hypothetical protein
VTAPSTIRYARNAPDLMLRYLTAAAALLAIAGALLLASPVHLLGAMLIVAGVAVFCYVRPTQGLWLVLLLSPIHPIVSRFVLVNLGASGLALNVFSAWKEVALTVVIAAELRPMALRYWDGARWRFRPKLMDVFAVGLVLLVGFGLLIKHDLLAINEVRLLLFPVGVYLAIRLNPIDAGSFFKAMAIVAVGISVFALVQGTFFGWSFITTYWGIPTDRLPVTFIAQGVDGPRAAGTFASPNELAFGLVAWAFMAIALIGMRPDKNRWLLIAVAVILAALSVTFSRSAILAAGAGMVVLIVAIARVSPNARRALTLVVLALLPSLLLSGAIYYERGGLALVQSTISSLVAVSSTSDEGGSSPTPSPTPSPGTSPAPSAPPGATLDQSTLSHLGSLRAGWSLVQANPLGTGLGTVGPRPLPGTSEFPLWVIESYYLGMGVSLGWLAFAWTGLLPLAMFLTAIAALRRGKSAAGVCLLGFSAAVAIISYFLPTMMEPQLAMIPWSLAALAASSSPKQAPNGETVKAAAQPA